MTDPAKYLTHPDVCEYRVFSTAIIPFDAAVFEACERNVCGRYGKSWTCPPGAGTPEELKARITSYPNALLISYKYDIEDSFDFEGMSEAQRRARKAFAEAVGLMREAGEEFLQFGNEGCDLCEKCTYPDAPCRFPERASPSIEACGINVMKLSREVGMKYINGPNTVTYFFMIVW